MQRIGSGRARLRTTSSHVCIGSVLALAVLAPAGALAAEPAPGPAPTASGTAVAEIVVTANKRAERLVDVPATITALTGGALQNQGITQFSDYIKVVPGLSAINAAAPGHGTPAMRGISTGTGQNAPTVSIYLDDIPFTPTSPISSTGAITFDPDLADVDRVEVLKGPQSTLYGASSMGGIIKIVTRKPSLTHVEGSLGVDGSAVDGGGLGYALRGSINLPLVDDLIALRVSVVSKEEGGFVGNVRTDQKNVNDSHTNGVRASLRIDPTSKVSTVFTVLDQQINGGAYAYAYLNPTTLKPLYGRYDYADYFNTAYRTTYFAASNTTTADLGFANLSNAVSFARTRDSEIRDYTAAYSPFIASAPPGSAIKGTFQPQSDRISDEIRLTSAPGRIEWLVGGFFTDERDHYGVQLLGLNPGTGAALAPPLNNIYTFDAYPTYVEEAVFGDLTYHVTDQFELAAGIRYSANQQSFRSPRSGVLGSSPIAPGRSSDSATTYSFTASYHPVPNTTLYLRAASAYRPGSTQPVTSTAIPAQYGPDHLWNYEAGAKGEWLEGRLAAEVSIYHIDWRDIQLNSRIGGFTVISNAGSATSDGVEANLVLKPIEGLTLGGEIAYNSAVLRSNDPAIGAVDGDPLPFAPRYTGAITADYAHPLFADVTGTIGATYSYQGSRYTSFSGDPLNTRFKLPDYQTLDLRVGANWDRYSMAFRVQNATNAYAFSSLAMTRVATTQTVPAVATLIQPRTFTLSFGVKF